MNYRIAQDKNLVFDFYFNFDNFKKLLNIKSYHLPSVDDLWSMFRHSYCPTRILKYGTLGRDLVGDDRTKWERVCDVVSDYLYKRRQEHRYGRAEYVGFSFFDWGLGQQITNMSQIHELEKKTGKTLVSWRDQEVEQAKIQRQLVVDDKRKIKEKIHHVFSEVQKGRKYTEEIKRQKEEFVRSFK